VVKYSVNLDLRVSGWTLLPLLPATTCLPGRKLMRRAIISGWVALFFAAAISQAYVAAPYSLGQVIKESTHIALVEVTRVDKQKNLIVYKKIKDIKGSHPGEQIKHNIGKNGFHAREWQNVMAWAEVGKKAVFFHNQAASETCMGSYWYQCHPQGDWKTATTWWAMSHAEPFLLRTYCGDAEKLAAACTAILENQEVIVSCMQDCDKDLLHERKAKMQFMRASLKRANYDAKRDFVSFATGEEAGQDVPDFKATADADPAKTNGGKPSAKQDDKYPKGLTVDKTKGTVTIDCAVAPRKLPNLERIYPIEVVACYPHPKGQKAHETVVTIPTDLKPTHMHKALEECGLKAGKPAKREGEKAQGPEVKLFLEFTGTDGKVKKLPFEQILVNIKTGQPIPALKWHFTGSAMKNPDPEKDDQVYGADLTGTLITILPVTDDTVLQSHLLLNDKAETKMEIAKNLLPKEGTAVKLIIETK